MTPPIVVDANVFLRYLVRAGTPQDVENAAEAASLFANCEQGQLEITTNSAVIAEVVFILASARHYALSRGDVVSRLVPLLQIPGCILPDKDFIIQALERWEDSEKLSFVDCLLVEQALANDAPLISFDTQVRKTRDIKLWRTH